MANDSGRVYKSLWGVEMAEKMNWKDYACWVILIVSIVLVFAFVVISIPTTHYNKVVIDGKIVKVNPFPKEYYFLVTFDLGNNNQAQYKIDSLSFDSFDAYTGRMLVRLSSMNDVWWLKWDGIYTVQSVTKLDNYGE